MRELIENMTGALLLVGITLSMGGCAVGTAGGAARSIVDQAQGAGEDDELTALNKLVTDWLGAAETPADRRLRTRLLLAGLVIVWDARLRFGRPAPEDFNLAYSAFTRLEQRQASLAPDQQGDTQLPGPTLWINSELYDVVVDVGSLVGESLYRRGIRAVTAAAANPLSLLASAQDLAVQAGAVRAAGADVEAIWQAYLAKEITAEQIDASVRAVTRRHLERLAAFMGLPVPAASDHQGAGSFVMP